MFMPCLETGKKKPEKQRLFNTILGYLMFHQTLLSFLWRGLADHSPHTRMYPNMEKYS